MYDDGDLLALSGLQHLAYCERQWALIHIEQQWADSFDTVRGDLFHERVHTEGYTAVRGVRAERGVRLASRRLGIAGVADIVEFSSGGDCLTVRPVEYKVGKAKIEDWDRFQVCAQALCLEEMYGCTVGEGALFYGETRRREAVLLDGSLKSEVERLSMRMHELFDAQRTPRAVKGAKCRRCSLADICLPEISEHDAVSYWNEGV
ncbi:MAG: CRISPR-associated protein Cas4 [Raoultibacter sp.]|uniref:CRISPR-associated protein Cas4 n=1 Tax=Gordonibacter sp. TaxID=1968902 RepID=UPI002FCB4CA3